MAAEVNLDPFRYVILLRKAANSSITLQNNLSLYVLECFEDIFSQKYSVVLTLLRYFSPIPLRFIKWLQLSLL